MPNALAYTMLMIWPLVTIALFRRMPIERAIVWTMLGGYLLLPPVANFDLPLVPAMNKYSIATLSAFAMCCVLAPDKLRIWHGSVTVRILLLLFVLGVIPTVLNNREPIVFEAITNSAPIHFVSFFIPGLSLRDVLSVMIGQIIVLLPFLLGRSYLATETGMREALLALVIGALFYSLPALIETLIGPIINIKIYGFFQHDFRQMIRGNGFRPVVFLHHGLWMAFFFVTAVLAAAALFRTSPQKDRMRWGLIVFYILIVLRACKSLASWSYGLALTPMVLFLGKKTLVRIAVAMALLAVSYPMLRNAELLPLDKMVAIAERIDKDRAQSLEFRFDNEEQLLARAGEKRIFGWGGWGRNFVHDPRTGERRTIPDGNWIIVFGTFGWIGYIAQMGLLSLPILVLFGQMQTQRPDDMSPYAAPIVLILAVTMIDMLINDTLTPYTWLCAGAVLGHVESLRYPSGRTQRNRLRKDPVIGGTRATERPKSIL